MIIGISGKARTGKDTAGGILKDELETYTGANFKLMAYGSVLKNHLVKNFNLSHEQLYGNLKEVEDKRFKKQDTDPVEYWTPREILQSYGEGFRAIDTNFWVNELFKSVADNIIITDLRHINEVIAVKERGGYHIRINREHNIEVHGTEHISETELDFVDDCEVGSIYKPDFKIENNNSIKDLTKAVKDIILIIYKLEEINKNKTMCGG